MLLLRANSLVTTFTAAGDIPNLVAKAISFDTEVQTSGHGVGRISMASCTLAGVYCHLHCAGSGKSMESSYSGVHTKITPQHKLHTKITHSWDACNETSPYHEACTEITLCFDVHIEVELYYVTINAPNVGPQLMAPYALAEHTVGWVDARVKVQTAGLVCTPIRTAVSWVTTLV